jgi:hypothetical protein
MWSWSAHHSRVEPKVKMNVTFLIQTVRFNVRVLIQVPLNALTD